MNIDKIVLLAIPLLLPGMTMAQDDTTSSHWETEEQHYDELDLHFVVLKTHALESAGPALVFRCYEDTTVVRSMRTKAAPYGPVTVQLDENEPEEYSMEAIDDGHAVGFWESADATAFIQSLFGAQTLSMSITPNHGDPMAMDFNIEGIKTMIAPVRDTCGW